MALAVVKVWVRNLVLAESMRKNSGQILQYETEIESVRLCFEKDHNSQPL
jgi:hypothetical protein